MQMPHALSLSARWFSELVRQGVSLLPVLLVLTEIVCTETRLHTQIYSALVLGHEFTLHFRLRFLQASNSAKRVENTTALHSSGRTLHLPLHQNEALRGSPVKPRKRTEQRCYKLFPLQGPLTC